MKKVLFGLTLIASAAAASAYPVCVSFAPAGYCDAMQYDGKKDATWVSYDCAGSAGVQTTAKYKKKAATTTCDGTKGCEPSTTYGWDTLDWAFAPKAGTGTLTGMFGGTEYILQQDMPIEVIDGACVATEGGRSTLAR